MGRRRRRERNIFGLFGRYVASVCEHYSNLALALEIGFLVLGFAAVLLFSGWVSNNAV